MVLFCTISLSTECFKCTCHAQQAAEGDADDDGSDDGDGGEVKVAEVAGECLCNDCDGEHGHAREDRWQRDVPRHL